MVFGMFRFSLKELTPQTVLRFGCVLVKIDFILGSWAVLTQA